LTPFLSLKKVLIGPREKFFEKLKNISKKAEFHADFKSVEKVLQNAPKTVKS
jgi:hypothetical protein